MRQDGIPKPTNYASIYSTTQKRLIYYWLTLMLIASPYLVCIYHVLTFIRIQLYASEIGTNNPLLAPLTLGILWLCAVSPLGFSLFQHSAWHLAISKRWILGLFGVLALITIPVIEAWARPSSLAIGLSFVFGFALLLWGSVNLFLQPSLNEPGFSPVRIVLVAVTIAVILIPIFIGFDQDLQIYELVLISMIFFRITSYALCAIVGIHLFKYTNANRRGHLAVMFLPTIAVAFDLALATGVISLECWWSASTLILLLLLLLVFPSNKRFSSVSSADDANLERNRSITRRALQIPIVLTEVFGIALIVFSRSFSHPLVHDDKLLPLVCAFALLVFLITSLPSQLLNRQATFQRSLLKHYRQSMLRRRFSANLAAPNEINSLIAQIKPFFSLDNPSIVLVTLVILGVVLGIAALIRNASASLLDAIVVGTAAFFISSIVYFFVWLVRHRRHIILPFQVSDPNIPMLQSIATFVPHDLVEQVQQIGLLLNQRQVELTNRGTNEAMALFVSSGLEPELFNEFETLVNIEAAGGNTIRGAVGSLLSVLARLFATEVVSGAVRLGKGNRPELWVEITRRHKKTSLGKFEIPLTIAADFDEKKLQSVIRHIAIDLTLQIGKNGKIASNAVSLGHLLDGLEASRKRNWWRAIEAYRDAIRIEEAEQGTFGIGYYQLGAALVLQGELEEGEKYLEQAEVSRVPVAETHYMLALVRLHQHWDTLDEDDVEFQDVVRRCKNAIVQRPHFPEVYSLLGAAYYQKSKLQHRRATQRYEQRNRSHTRDYRTGYRRAAWYFQKAISQYERIARQLSTVTAFGGIAHDDLMRISREQISVTHRLADALRSAGRYVEAYSQYTDVLAVFPGNVTTFADLAKTYCLAGSWQHADEFLRREVLILPEAYWDPHVNLHAGWAYAGGVADFAENFWRKPAKDKPTTQLSRLLVCLGWFNTPNGNLPRLWLGLPRLLRVRRRKLADLQISVRQLDYAMSHIDFALHQRPQYITRWQQTDWQEPFLKACAVLLASTKQCERDLRCLYGSNLVAVEKLTIDDLDIHIHQLRLWLAWRMDSRSYHDGDDPLMKHITRYCRRKDNKIPMHNFRDSVDDALYPYPPLKNVYRELKAQRRGYTAFLNELRDSGRLHGMRHRLQKLDLGAKALDYWKVAHKTVSEELLNQTQIDAKHPQPITFGARWAIDVYAEQSLFAARLLVEAGAFETAWIVADESSQKLQLWIDKRWTPLFGQQQSNAQSNFEKTAEFKFSPRVLRFQLATLIAIKAYCAVYMKQDVKTKARLIANRTLYDGRLAGSLTDEGAELAYQRARADVADALRYMPRHPLAMFVQALLLRKQGRRAEAIDQLHRLLSVLSPFDPNLHIANWQPSKKRKPQGRAIKDIDKAETEKELRNYYRKALKTKSLRAWLGQQAKVSGMQQLDNIVDVSEVHRVLSNALAEHGELELSVRHLMEAASWSPYWDVESDCLLLVIRRLERLDRYREAKAIISALRTHRQILETNTLSITKVREPEILSCIIASRLGNHAEALGFGLATENSYLTMPSSPPTDPYKNRLLHYRLRERYDQMRAVLIAKRWDLRPRSAKVSQFDTALNTLLKVYNLKLSVSQREDLQQLATFYFQPDKLADLLVFFDRRDPQNAKDVVISELYGDHDGKEVWRSRPILNNKWNITSTMLEFLAREAVVIAEQYSELNNNIVYNAVEQGFSATEIEALDANTRIENALALLGKMEAAAPPDVSAYKARYRQYIAQYYDTKAWHIFRTLDPMGNADDIRKKLADARRIIAEQGLYYDGTSSILYYHVTRIELTMLERLWQSLDPTTEAQETAKRASEIDEHLSRAIRYWSSAQTCDVNGRLEDKLDWIGERLIKYREAWFNRHLRTFGGNDAAKHTVGSNG